MANREFPWGKSFLIVLLFAATGYGVYRYVNREDEQLQYQTAAVTRGSLTQMVTATGQLNPVVNVQVGSQISGIIQRLFADYNTTVKSNQIIAQLDPATYRANVHSAEGELANGEAALELAQVESRRATELHKNNLIAQADYDKSIAALHEAEAQVKIRTAALERAKVDLDRCTITAPVDGIVISRNVDVGQTVAASLQAPVLFVIANDLTKMQIDANVAEADIGGIEVGQDVEFTVDAFPYRTFRGKVMQVRNAPITVQNVVTYDTVIGVDNPDQKLKPGMTANVSVVIARRENVLKAPNAALRFRPPEAALAEMKSNVVAQASPSAAVQRQPGAGAAGAGMRGGGAEGRRPGFGGMGGSGRPREERRVVRTIYVLEGTGPNAKPKAVQIKTGISDGVFTEIVEGLEENQAVITAALTGDSTSPAQRPANPFGGGPRRF